MLTNISLNLINRVKYQLCQSQKSQYHLCGDELCARLLKYCTLVQNIIFIKIHRLTNYKSLWTFHGSWTDCSLFYNYRLTTWQLTQCIIATFFNYKDITKDVFLLVKMTISVGGVFIEDLSSFAFLVSPKPSYVFLYYQSHFTSHRLELLE